MSFRVLFTDCFKTHLEGIGDYIAPDSPSSAFRWIEELEKQLRKLKKFPDGYPTARENQRHEIELRQMLYGKGRNKYRVIYTITEDEAIVLDIRHGAMSDLPKGGFD